MSIRSQAALDLQANVNADGDAVTLTDPDDTEYQVIGTVYRADMADDGTGVKYYEPKTGVKLSLKDLASEPTEEWKVSTTDVMGNAISGQIRDPRFNRTTGFVTFIIEAVN